MFIHVKMPQITTSTWLGIKKNQKKLPRHTVILPWELRKWRRFHPQDVTALYHVAFLATALSISICVCACVGWCVCVCSQVHWHFLKRGWHFQGIWGFDPFCVWRVVCWPPQNTGGKMRQQSRQRALPWGPYSAAFGATRRHAPEVWSGESLHCTLPAFLEMTGFTAWSFT